MTVYVQPQWHYSAVPAVILPVTSPVSHSTQSLGLTGLRGYHYFSNYVSIQGDRAKRFLGDFPFLDEVSVGSHTSICDFCVSFCH